MSTPIWLPAFGLVVTTLAALVTRLLVIASPDEWLLLIRDGRLVRAGIGVSVWRRPGDVVARFSSTMQRVGFVVEALSSERVACAIEGFILWSVAPEGDGPFTAFRKLGVVDRGSRASELRHAKHLLSTPQHRAFQRLLAAAVQRLASSMSLDAMLLHQDELVKRLRDELARLEADMGILVDRVEIVSLRPADSTLLRRMAAPTEARLREAEAAIVLETDERTKMKELASASRLGEERALERRRELERERDIDLARIDHERSVKQQALELARERALAEEARDMDVARASQAREELLLAARLDRLRREADAQRDAAQALASAEEQKSQPVRDHELARLVAEQVGQALRHLPIKDARWVTVGPDTPAATIASLVTVARELIPAARAGGGAAPRV